MSLSAIEESELISSCSISSSTRLSLSAIEESEPEILSVFGVPVTVIIGHRGI